MRLRRGDRRLQGEVRPHRQRAQPDAGSGDEIEAIKANKGNTGPQAPDVIDVGLSFGPSAKADGLIQPYKVSTWDTIPDSAKDADGYWYGDYYGVLSFEVNNDIVKKIAGRLGRPAVRPTTRTPSRSPAIRARPTRRSRRSTPPVSPAPTAMPAEAGDAGLKFFADLNKAGNFVPVDRQGRARSPRARRRSSSAGTTTRSPTRHA